MAKAHIKTSNGAEITVEGDSAEIAKIVSQVQNASESNAASRRNPSVVQKKREVKKQRTASDLIVGMKEDGFFSKPRALSEVASELQKEGRLFPVTTLSGVMLSLVQKKILSRIKKDRHWVYGNR